MDFLKVYLGGLNIEFYRKKQNRVENHSLLPDMSGEPRAILHRQLYRIGPRGILKMQQPQDPEETEQPHKLSH